MAYINWNGNDTESSHRFCDDSIPSKDSSTESRATVLLLWKERNRTKREIRDYVFFMDRSSMVDGASLVFPFLMHDCCLPRQLTVRRAAGMNKVGLLVDVVSYGTKLWMVDLRSRDFRPNRIATKFKDALIRAGGSGRHKVIF